MKNKIKWGIIGLGKIARKFAHDLQLSNDGLLYAIASRSEDGVRKFQSEFPAQNMYTNYEDLLDDPEVDVVYIATPHSHHYPWILKCLDSGKHVLCEKPICVNADQVAEVIKKQKSTGLFVMEALWTKFLPAYEHLQQELRKDGEPVLSLSADFCYSSARQKGSRIYEPGLAGGSLLDIGIYPLFLALDILGVPEQYHVSGWVDQGIDVRVSAVMNYDQGRSALVYSDVQSMGHMDAVIRKENKVYVLPHRWHELDYFHEIGPDYKVRHDFPKTGWGYFHEIEHVNECLIDGLNQSPIYPLSWSFSLARYMDGFRESLNLSYPANIEKI
ncbi:Gfo/Idh/MocA family oxidoreductase [Membranicola marinus]|uniref:Gfo/Idh/MocA family oxidoreductase n=1 Tax=Membranihabitans marinus TaxID=1227546 RepID=A0A953LC50_9BACT|nr:Gfo/Idh/MocA family oxidoreductase [Membranihabitans marinus]MBY5957389.1 Gfo/Idh/MocA family oxidoreductase [Membranihabitans marinus]